VTSREAFIRISHSAQVVVASLEADQRASSTTTVMTIVVTAEQPASGRPRDSDGAQDG
jgi:hypothetical protein